jgi:hypothetical protein
MNCVYFSAIMEKKTYYLFFTAHLFTPVNLKNR